MTEEVKKLYRSQTNRYLGGVCGGLGEYFNIDATIVRLLFVAFALVVGGGILLYLIMWIVIPAEPEPAAPTSPEEE